MKIVFLGTPEIARVCLEEILKSKHEVLAVVTNPDRPFGRGNKLLPSPVKTFAESKGLKVLPLTPRYSVEIGVAVGRSSSPAVQVFLQELHGGISKFLIHLFPSALSR